LKIAPLNSSMNPGQRAITGRELTSQAKINGMCAIVEPLVLQ
jgi:hypothetical protein